MPSESVATLNKREIVIPSTFSDKLGEGNTDALDNLLNTHMNWVQNGGHPSSGDQLEVYGPTIDKKTFINGDLRYARFSQTIFYNCTFISVDLSSTVFSKCTFIRCEFSFCTFDTFDLSKSVLIDCYFESCSFKTITVAKTLIDSCIFERVTFNFPYFKNTDLTNSTFSGSGVLNLGSSCRSNIPIWAFKGAEGFVLIMVSFLAIYTEIESGTAEHFVRSKLDTLDLLNEDKEDIVTIINSSFERMKELRWV